MPTFNLIDEDWIPCVSADANAAQTLSLREVFDRAPFIREIADPSPIVVAALHRLLLAILHRAHRGPASASDWEALWTRGRFDDPRLATYLDQWRDCFDLFDHTLPFYQVASLGADDVEKYRAPVARLSLEQTMNTGNALFNHTSFDAARLTPARAARAIVTHQAFAVGGLITFETGADQKTNKSADAAPLTKGAVVLARGSNLFETLMLNLVHYNRADGEPFAFFGDDDRPAWERTRVTIAEDRQPAGYVDLLTWQSRRIRLLPTADDSGLVAVDDVIIMKGNQFPSGFERRDHETMLAFRKVEKPQSGQDPWPVVAFQEERALWRDSAAIFQSTADQYQRPRTLTWLSDLARGGIIDRARTIPLEVLGLAVDRAKVFFWRQERLLLPVAYLEDRDLFGSLRRALHEADEGARALRSAGYVLATYLAAPNADRPNGREPRPEDVRPIAGGLALDRNYWPALDTSYQRLLRDLPGSPGDDEAPRRTWAGDVRAAALSSFGEVERGLDSSARGLKAVALARRSLNKKLREIFDPQPATG